MLSGNGGTLRLGFSYVSLFQKELMLDCAVLVPGKKYPETGVILESEFCM